MKTLNPEIFNHPDQLIFEGHGPKAWMEALLPVVAVVAGVVLLYMGLTPERRHYRFGVYITLPDPNWFLFGVGIAVLILALFLFIHFINVRFCTLKIYPDSIGGYGVAQTLVHLVLPVKVPVSEIRSVDSVKNSVFIHTESRNIRFYLSRPQEAQEILEALMAHQESR